ncbi:CinA family protein [Parabacteroides sp. 52]|uniref:CinA family protein n=1 Tax=unclassified Parabacteroides TaxID=2649774 RepID=UPI0013D1F988|nr:MULTISPECIES: CinA family protein [unclassified Parabacteroides]MDH6534861.1 nicotinamide-nucleotide amidase [Parabacteroides sp. PM5-20]NDV55578.1 CinA family protein [Parabacteroides sp. 52]
MNNSNTSGAPLPSLEEQIGQLLLAKGYMLGTAESCTGGRIASMITSLPGSSRYFAGGIVSYSNAVKSHVLGVSIRDLDRFGAVSHPVVEQMVSGALSVLGCDCAVATSGIAGPGGGTPGKPVGTVYIAAATPDKVKVLSCHFEGDRAEVIRQSAEKALTLLGDLLSSNS